MCFLNPCYLGYRMKYIMGEEHAGFCIRSIKYSKNLSADNEDVPPTENFDFAAALESIYPLMNMIFSYLNYDDLKVASKVKESWKYIAKEELKMRNSPSWVTCYKGKRKSNIIEHSDNLHYSNATIGFILYDYRRLKLNKYICLHTPEILKMTFAEYFAKEIVPKNINYCLISCPKVVSHFGTHMLNTNGSLFDGIFFPEIEGVRITMFHCNPKKRKLLEETINDHIGSAEKAKCILLFSIGNLHPHLDNLFKCLIPSENFEEVAVCGGIIRGTKTFQRITAQRTFSTSDTFCVVFLEEFGRKTNFNATSHVIKGDDLTDDEFESELLELKKRVIMRANSVAIRVCCAAKWANKESESALFHKLFPNTPLLGLEADGELGWSSYKASEDNFTDAKKNSKKSRRSCPVVEHQWSTVLLVLSWGELK